MKVWELKKLLNTVSQEAEIIIATDTEGNGFSPVSEVDISCKYKAETEYDGDIVLKDEEIPGGDNGVPAVVFWPIN